MYVDSPFRTSSVRACNSLPPSRFGNVFSIQMRTFIVIENASVEINETTQHNFVLFRIHKTYEVAPHFLQNTRRSRFIRKTFEKMHDSMEARRIATGHGLGCKKYTVVIFSTYEIIFRCVFYFLQSVHCKSLLLQRVEELEVSSILCQCRLVCIHTSWSFYYATLRSCFCDVYSHLPTRCLSHRRVHWSPPPVFITWCSEMCYCEMMKVCTLFLNTSCSVICLTNFYCLWVFLSIDCIVV